MNMFLVKIIPYFRLKQLENHTLKCGTYPYSLYIGVPPPLGYNMGQLASMINVVPNLLRTDKWTHICVP